MHPTVRSLASTIVIDNKLPFGSERGREREFLASAPDRCLGDDAFVYALGLLVL